MGAEIGEAMAYVHSLSVLHRDLSGRNILLHGPSLHVKVSDFGLARRYSLTQQKLRFSPIDYLSNS
jgi:eukaryotic-like serine/threonine-protein kinase